MLTHVSAMVRLLYKSPWFESPDKAS